MNRNWHQCFVAIALLMTVHSVAVADSKGSATLKSSDEWVENGEITSDMQGNCRKSVTKKEARNLHLGMSLQDFNDHT